MSLPVAAEASLIVDRQVDVLGALRHALERRAFDCAVLQSIPRQSETGRSATFFEAASFMEADATRLRELVITLLGAASTAGIEVVLWLRGRRDGVRFRYAVVHPAADAHSTTLGPDFQRMLEGALPGVVLKSMPAGPDDDLARDLGSLRDHAAAGVMLGIPSERLETSVETRLDDVLNGLAGRSFDLVVHAVPAERRDIDIAEDNLAHVVSLAHQLTTQQLSVSDSESFTESVARGVSASWSKTETTSWSASESRAVSAPQKQGLLAEGAGAAAGAVVGAIIGAVVGAPSGPGAGVTAAAGAKTGAVLGTALGGALGRTIVPPVQETKTSSSTTGGSSAAQVGGGTSHSETEAVAHQWGHSVSIERLNRQAALIGELAELHLSRVRQMRSLGAWHVTVHLASESTNDLQLASSMLAGALRGDTSHLEPIKLVPAAPESVPGLLDRVVGFNAVHLATVPHPLIPGGEQPSTLLSSEELSNWFRPPTSPIVGVDVRPLVSFGASALPPTTGKHAIRIGRLIAGGRTLSQPAVAFDADDLVRHCFIAGTTGSGKTSTLRSILLQLSEQGVPFLVIEPAKSEYRALFAELERRRMRPLRLSLRGGSTPDDRALRFNPWRAPAGAVLGRHVEGMKVLLRSCFAMQESLPQILERAIFDMYAEKGWPDLAAIVSRDEAARFPTFADFVAPGPAGAQSFLQRTIRSLDYRAEATGNLSAAVTVRLQSFTRGLKGQLFRDEDGQFDELFSRPTFIELSELNEPDIKRFLLGALVMRLATELEVKHQQSPRKGLRHVLVLEEAHHFLREGRETGPGAELARQGNALLADAFAEMRAFGEGIVVADQAPAELSPAVLRNTNIKIAHRLLYEQDCAAMGDAMGLDDAQRKQLRALRPGECVVHGPSFGRPVACRVDREEEF